MPSFPCFSTCPYPAAVRAAMTMSPPPLPPRHSRSRSDTAHLTPEPNAPYSRGADAGFHDPRSSSTQSLVPNSPPVHNDARRTLLLIFVHGFMGDETSFQSFPAHLHNVVTLTLSETHAVHTKIYPRYRSRRRLQHATEEFSRWLQPHLDPDTDVILLGHSMGGLLTADVVLLPGASPHPFRHRILGTISFDTPFLGMHPGVIKSGLSSIFRPAPEKSPERQPESGLTSQSSQATSTSTLQSFHTAESSGVTSPPPRTGTLFSTNPNDPNYNPSFQNDVILPVRKGWSNAWHFVNKHSDGLVTASKQLVKAHLEFGGAMADYGELKKRYKRIRALEEEDETRRRAAVEGRAASPIPRVRFINFYTASTGRLKSTIHSGSVSPNRSIEQASELNAGLSHLSLTSSYQDSSSMHSHSVDASLTSPPSGRDEGGESVEYLTPMHSHSESASPRGSADMQQMSPRPLSDAGSIPPQTEVTPATPSSPTVAPEATFPDAPPLPVRPVTPDLSAETDVKARKAAEKAHGDAVKAYKQAIKQQEQALKQLGKQALKAEKEARKEEARLEKERQKEERARQKQSKSALDVSKDGNEDESEETQKTGEELRLERERQRMEAEGQRMAAAEAERLRVQRRMLGLPPDGGEKEAAQETACGAEADERQGQEKEEEKHDASAGKQQQHHLPVDSPAPPYNHNSASLSSSCSRSPSPAPSFSHRAPSIATITTTSSSHHPAPPPSQPSPASPTLGTSSPSPHPSSSSAKPSKDRKFCMLPSNHAADPTWIRVFMRDVDEVGAHCGLFFVGDTYAMLVGEVAATVERWVLEDVGERWASSQGEVGQVL
ncbi:uncharacterized protein IWZ02DRAFT_453010 [Phyllosticta citriasiana]|uniref:AB hydrolase-1 domain-containing protein n=1 Tax=Phyllosticta citriasiana TaxID=595635 RepID=A0ABR1KYL7_9PEZI